MSKHIHGMRNGNCLCFYQEQWISEICFYYLLFYSIYLLGEIYAVTKRDEIGLNVSVWIWTKIIMLNERRKVPACAKVYVNKKTHKKQNHILFADMHV